MLQNDQLTIVPSSVATPPSGYRADLWKETNVVDGNAGTPWVPKDSDSKPRLTLTFPDGKQDVQLICIVNGQATDIWSYLRAERIRTAYVYNDITGMESGIRAPLRTLGEYDLQNRQPLTFAKGETTKLVIEIAETYEGRKVKDPDVNKYMDRVFHPALGEIELYKKDPNEHKRFLFF